MEWICFDSATGSCWDANGECAPKEVSPENVLIVGAELTGAECPRPDALPGALLPKTLSEGPRGRYVPPLGEIAPMMRLRLLGFQAMNPHWDGVALVVGEKRTLWVTLSAREAIHLQASVTGELATALHCNHAELGDVDAAMSRAERLPFLLAEAKDASARLAALLGAEMAAAKRLWLGQQVALIGAGPLAKAYLKALQSLYVPVTETVDKALIREGFRTVAQGGFPGDQVPAS